MNRRGLLGGLVAALALGGGARQAHAKKQRLRPPGARPPGDFEAACIGCFRCAEVCPTKTIHFPTGLSLDAATPYLDYADAACVLCLECIEVCPTDALQPVTKQATRIGTPKLERGACLSWSGSGVCRLCYEVCPFPERAIELVGPQKSPVFHAEACVGCGLCEEACPDLARAITIEPGPAS